MPPWRGAIARDERSMADVDAAVASLLSSGEIAGLARRRPA